MGEKKLDKTVVIGTIGADCHVIGSWMLRHAFEEAGFNVVYLGAVVPQEDYINAAVETNADAILVSSLYGMGILDCEGMREKCTEAGLKDILLYAGGILTAETEKEEKSFEEIANHFINKLGFNRVYPPKTLPKIPIDDLKKDLEVG